MALESVTPYRGFITPTKTLLVQAAKAVFDASFHVEKLRSLHVSIEYPNKSQDYPGLWVDFNTTGQIEIAGIDHEEIETDDEDDVEHRLSRWRFDGSALYTCVALTSLERDMLVDEVVMILAGWDAPQAQPFRGTIEDNEFIALHMNFDQVSINGISASPGTPWGTDDILYEGTVSIQVTGEFAIDKTLGVLGRVSEVNLYPYSNLEPDPLPTPDAENPWF